MNILLQGSRGKCSRKIIEEISGCSQRGQEVSWCESQMEKKIEKKKKVKKKLFSCLTESIDISY